VNIPTKAEPSCENGSKKVTRLSSSEVRFYSENGRFAFVSPFWEGGLGQRTMIISGSMESA